MTDHYQVPQFEIDRRNEQTQRKTEEVRRRWETKRAS